MREKCPNCGKEDCIVEEIPAHYKKDEEEPTSLGFFVPSLYSCGNCYLS